MDAMLNEASRGTLAGSGFRKASWRRILAEVRYKTEGQFACTNQHLQTQFSELKKKYFLCKQLQKMDNFKFDDVSHTFHASPEAWNQMSRKHPIARRLIHKPVPFYNELELLFSKDVIGTREERDYTQEEGLDVPPLSPEDSERPCSTLGEPTAEEDDSHTPLICKSSLKGSPAKRRGSGCAKKGNDIALLSFAASHKRMLDVTTTSAKRLQLSRNSYTFSNLDNPVPCPNSYSHSFEHPSSSHAMSYGGMYPHRHQHHPSQPPVGYIPMSMPYYMPTQPYMYPNMNCYPPYSSGPPPMMPSYATESPAVWIPSDSHAYSSTGSYSSTMPATSSYNKHESNQQTTVDPKTPFP
jgi:hypothetical protein